MKTAAILLAIAQAQVSGPELAFAQVPAVPPAAPAAAPDAARVAAARALLDVILPPATREATLKGMMQPMVDNLRSSMTHNAEFQAALDQNVKLKILFDQFVAKQQQRIDTMMHDMLPDMLRVMTNAYARRFDVAQLNEIRRFFETPTGRAYMQGSLTIMSDPDVASWQRQLTTQAMAKVQEDIAEFTQAAAAALGQRKP